MAAAPPAAQGVVAAPVNEGGAPAAAAGASEEALNAFMKSLVEDRLGAEVGGARLYVCLP